MKRIVARFKAINNSSEGWNKLLDYYISTHDLNLLDVKFCNPADWKNPEEVFDGLEEGLKKSLSSSIQEDSAFADALSGILSSQYGPEKPAPCKLCQNGNVLNPEILGFIPSKGDLYLAVYSEFAGALDSYTCSTDIYGLEILELSTKNLSNDEWRNIYETHYRESILADCMDQLDMLSQDGVVDPGILEKFDQKYTEGMSYADERALRSLLEDHGENLDTFLALPELPD